jgi:hypothetical protein
MSRSIEVAELLREPCPMRWGEKHCLHRSAVQHAKKYHADEYCCFCGEEFCIDTQYPDPDHGYLSKHGPHLGEGSHK